MLTAAPLPIPDPTLAQAPVQALLAHFASALPWLSHARGLVQTGVAKDGKSRMPQLYRQDGTIYSDDLYPDQSCKAVSWFERDGASVLEWNDQLAQTGTWQHPLAAVVWLNLPAIDPNRGYDFSDELALDFMTRGLLASPIGSDLLPGSLEQRAELVFRRYQWPQERQQLLMYPYAAFRLPFVARQRYVACAQPFVPAAQPLVRGTTMLPAATSITAGSLVALNNQGASILYDATLPPDAQTFVGIAVTSGTPGQQVQVQASGQVHVENWGLVTGTTYLAGPVGRLATTNEGLYFSQTMGRSLSPDDFQLDPKDITIL